MDPDLRRRWVTDDLLRGTDLTANDAVETAVAEQLRRRTNTHRARAAFRALAPRLREELIAGNADLWVVVGQTGHYFHVTSSAAEAAEYGASVERTVWILSLGGVIRAARAQYEHLIADSQATQSAAVHPLPQREVR